MSSLLLLRGFALGFAIAASPGPIFFLCVNRTLVRGRLYGLVSGLGVATADAMYSALATFGVAAVTSILINGRRPLALLGGAILIGLGLRMLLERKPPTRKTPAPDALGLGWAYLSTLGLTITNPATIVSFAALAATLGLGTSGALIKPALVVAGVLAGSAVWWGVLALIAGMLRERLTPRVARGIGITSGLIIALLGAAAIATALVS